nr:PqqD family protein [uncultured Holophaga sp.]
MQLDWTPLQALPFEVLEDGQVVIIRPKFLSPRWKWLQKRLGRPNFRVKLDAKGALIWGLCDGHHSIQAICDQVREAHGEDHTTERTAWFIRELYQGGFVK